MALVVDRPSASLHVVGRGSEIHAIDDFLAPVRPPADASGGLRALEIVGEPGMGKTTLWQIGVSHATERGYRVLSSSPVEGEADLPHAGLSDLLEEVVPEIAARLPAPQHLALRAALLDAETATEGDAARALGVGVLNVLRLLAAQGPLVVAVDDLQWLDASSARILRFALRRLGNQPVRLLLASRSGAADSDLLELDRTVGAERCGRVMVGPLRSSDLAVLLRERLHLTLPRPSVMRVLAASGGNPFYALEIGRALQRDGMASSSDEPVPLPRRLRSLVQGRLSALSDTSLQALAVAAAMARPTPASIRAAMAGAADADLGLAEAEEAEIIKTDAGSVTFTHPLLASIAYTSIPATRRRLLHRQLAAIIEDPDERARHLSLGVEPPDAAVAATLEDAATAAVRRGAPEVAARLLDRAVVLTLSGAAQDLRRRRLAAAQAHLASGDATRARGNLQDALAVAKPGPERAEVKRALAALLTDSEGVEPGTRMYGEALAEAEGDAGLLGRIHFALAWNSCWLGDVPAAHEHARRSLEHAEEAGDPRLRMLAMTGLGEIRFHLGLDPMLTGAREALELELAFPEAVSLEFTPAATLATQLIRADQLAEARVLLRRGYGRALEAGDELARAQALYGLGYLECHAGDWTLARRYAEEGYEIALQGGFKTMHAALAYAGAHASACLGDVEEARALASEGLEVAEGTAHHWLTIRNLGVLGFLELSLGRPAAAVPPLDRAMRIMLDMGIGEPGSFHGIADLVEALVSSGDLDRAREHVIWLEERGQATARSWALGVGARGRGLLYGAEGELGAATAALELSLRHLQGIEQPFEEARSHLLLGTVLRRAGERRAGRESLETAHRSFDELGARLWKERARSELNRISGRAPGRSGALTETEARVAALVAGGLTNREVADRLFVTPRTVEANLTRIFGKLGVRSRSELAARYPSEAPASQS